MHKSTQAHETSCHTFFKSAGGRHITNRIKVEMHAFWNVLEWLANTILFIWVGIALGFVLLQPADEGLRVQEINFSHHLKPTDAGYAVVLYLWLLVSRQDCCFGHSRQLQVSSLCAACQVKLSSMCAACQVKFSSMCAACQPQLSSLYMCAACLQCRRCKPYTSQGRHCHCSVK